LTAHRLLVVTIALSTQLCLVQLVLANFGIFRQTPATHV
jgi:hypothetical protein